MNHSFLNGAVSLFNADCLSFLRGFSDDSVDLILTDPPYFQVKRDAWDNQWASVEEYLSWLDEVMTELCRVLKPAGSIYLFCGHKLSADTEVLMRHHFNVLNHIVWAKPYGRWNGAKKEELRAFFPSTERILFAEHHDSARRSNGERAYKGQCEEVRRTVFEPLISYFKQVRESVGVSAKEINKATGTQMCSHWFGASQWQLPSREQYEKLQALFVERGNRLARQNDSLEKEYIELGAEYNLLNRQYEDLKIEYKSLRRHFRVTKDTPYTDVWTFAPVPHYPGKHPCEKPAEIIEHALNASSKEGSVVLDVFMGSGSTGKACVKLNRRFIGVEMDKDIYSSTLDSFSRLAMASSQPCQAE